MSLAPGLRVGSYEISALIGAGGMGEVYRARDTKLNRNVALKVLPEAFTQDTERIARFKREAQVLASLNHPNIGGIYGFEDATDLHAIVMEFVEGPTLANVIAGSGLSTLGSGPGIRQSHKPKDQSLHALSVAEALAIARQIAEALEAAHEQGIVHRDLKPANIKVRDDGTVKVLDFGLAKAIDSAGGAGKAGRAGSEDVSQSPTITTPAMTAAGFILGTAAYMSPEQAKGRPADKRSDVWAFGAVLFEMLTGRRAFEGEDVSDTLAAVLRGEPDWNALPADLPEPVRLLIKRCLERDRHKRVSDIGVARFVLNEPLAEQPIAPISPESAVPLPRPPLWNRALPALAASLGTAMVVVAASRYFQPPVPPQTVTRFSYDLAEGLRFTNAGRHVLAISPDGSRIAFVANQQLFLKAMWEAEAAPVRGTGAPPAQSAITQGTGGVTSPVFSPDGQWLAFWASNEIKKVPLSGGTPVTVGRAIDNPMGMVWDGDRILVGQGAKGALSIPADGGEPGVLVPPQSNELVHRPQLLPGGKVVIYSVAHGFDGWDEGRVVAQTIGSAERKTLVEGGSDARYLRTGHLLYAVAGVVFAAPFDPVEVAVQGQPQPVVEGVTRASGGQTGTTQMAVSDSGATVYVPGPPDGLGTGSDLAFVGLEGGVEPLKLTRMFYGAPRFSPDGRQIATGATIADNEHIWIHDVSGTSALRQLTFEGKNRFPVWTADGARVAFQSDREGDKAIFWQPEDGSAKAERLTTPGAGEEHVPDGWFPDGDRLLLSVVSAKGVSLWTFRLQDRSMTPFGSDIFGFLPHAAISPDGRWVTYDTGQGVISGLVYVQPFPPSGVQHRIAVGVNPFWAPDGKSLFYANPAALNFSLVGITTRPAFRVDAQPKAIPRPSPVGGGPRLPRQYDIAPDGKRFVIVVSADTSNPTTRPRLNVVLNWFEELKARVPVN